LVNIAFARAAAALASLAGNRVELTAPEASTCPVTQLGPTLARFIRGEVATVHQMFGGPVAGDALLVLEVDGAKRLAGLLTGVPPPAGELAGEARDTLVEVGNILLNACLGVFGDLLKVRFTFALPGLHLESLEAMVESLRVEGELARHALVVGARFEARTSEVTGCMVLVTSLETFVRAVVEWADRSVSGP